MVITRFHNSIEMVFKTQCGVQGNAECLEFLAHRDAASNDLQRRWLAKLIRGAVDTFKSASEVKCSWKSSTTEYVVERQRATRKMYNKTLLFVIVVKERCRWAQTSSKSAAAERRRRQRALPLSADVVKERCRWAQTSSKNIDAEKSPSQVAFVAVCWRENTVQV